MFNKNETKLDYKVLENLKLVTLHNSIIVSKRTSGLVEINGDFEGNRKHYS